MGSKPGGEGVGVRIGSSGHRVIGPSERLSPLATEGTQGRGGKSEIEKRQNSTWIERSSARIGRQNNESQTTPVRLPSVAQGRLRSTEEMRRSEKQRLLGLLQVFRFAPVSGFSSIKGGFILAGCNQAGAPGAIRGKAKITINRANE